MSQQDVYNRSALAQYRQINAQTGVVDADPHRLIQLLLDGAIDRIAQARGAVASGDKAAVGEALGKALGIIGGLQGCLDRDKGGEVAANLDRLYDYMTRRLLDVHRGEGAAPLDEVSGLLTTIRSGWEGIRSQLPVESPSS
ncbi:MAG: flagellar export chaperone FliS [Pseudomonadales bacterium]|jgi:flagellar protein FliS|nr:flagellar export chaperone FliS [Pseudomonadales bacterium]MCP5337601.1 flagellar export chaperone FliS [Pseudomonadales bacterium]